MLVTRENIQAQMLALGYIVFDKGDYNLNVVGLRRKNGIPNAFDDRIVCFFKKLGSWRIYDWPATTDPGTYWLKSPMRLDGTAILMPGQYRSSHKLGLHRGQYEALVQCAPLRVWRDNDRDLSLDYGVNPQEAPANGINLHRAGASSTRVDKWSAGCQVFARSADFAQFISFVKLQKNQGLGDKISYTLLEWDFD